MRVLQASNESRLLALTLSCVREHLLEQFSRGPTATWAWQGSQVNAFCNFKRGVRARRRSAYNMVINKYGERLYKGLVDTVSKHLVGVAARVEAAASGDAFLRDLTARWEDHNKSMQMIRDILMVSPLCSCPQRFAVSDLQPGLMLPLCFLPRPAAVRTAPELRLH